MTPSAKYRSLCIIDGDSQQAEDQRVGVFRLPGGQPEAHVFNDVCSNLASNIALLTVSLQLPPTKQDSAKGIITEIALTNREPHVIFNQIGIKLGFIPEEIVKGAFVNLWLREHAANALTPFVNRIRDEIDLYNGEQAASDDGIPADR
jgi:hypothetical protein